MWTSWLREKKTCIVTDRILTVNQSQSGWTSVVSVVLVVLVSLWSPAFLGLSVGLCQSSAPKWLIAFVNADEAVIVIDLWSLSGHSLVSYVLQCEWCIVHLTAVTVLSTHYGAAVVNECHWTSFPLQLWHSDFSTDTHESLSATVWAECFCTSPFSLHSSFTDVLTLA